MKIEVSGFKIEPSEGFVKFDLFKKRVFTSGKNVGGHSWEAEAYGVSFERAVEIIIQRRTESEVSDVDLRGFIEEYNRISDDTCNEIRKILVEAQGTSANREKSL